MYVHKATYQESLKSRNGPEKCSRQVPFRTKMVYSPEDVQTGNYTQKGVEEE